MPRIESVDLFYVAMPEVADISDGSQDALLVRIEAGGQVGWGEAEASPLPSIASWIAPMSHGYCHPIRASVLGQAIDSPDDIRRIGATVKRRSVHTRPCRAWRQRCLSPAARVPTASRWPSR